MKRCLVVDDSRVIRKIACRLLEAMQFETVEAEDGAAALDECRAKMPDLILLDGQMPNMGGTEFLRKLRKELNGRRPAVVLCVTENDLGQISEALNAGANEYIMKPFDRENLAAKLAEIGAI